MTRVAGRVLTGSPECGGFVSLLLVEAGGPWSVICVRPCSARIPNCRIARPPPPLLLSVVCVVVVVFVASCRRWLRAPFRSWLLAGLVSFWFGCGFFWFGCGSWWSSLEQVFGAVEPQKFFDESTLAKE